MLNFNGTIVDPAARAVAAQTAQMAANAVVAIDGALRKARPNPIVEGCSVTGPAYGAWEEAATALTDGAKSVTEAMAADGQSLPEALDNLMQADQHAANMLGNITPNIRVR